MSKVFIKKTKKIVMIIHVFDYTSKAYEIISVRYPTSHTEETHKPLLLLMTY